MELMEPNGEPNGVNGAIKILAIYIRLSKIFFLNFNVNSLYKKPKLAKYFIYFFFLS